MGNMTFLQRGLRNGGRALALGSSLVVVAGLLSLVAAPEAAAAAETVDTVAAASGRWLTEPRDGIIEVTVNGAGKLEGRIVGGSHPGRLDEKNPDAAQRDKPLRGQLILRDMSFEGKSHWTGGTIYDPDSGKTYKCNLDLLADGSLKVRGYIGFSLLGKSQMWTRYTGASLDLPAKP
jgi:uncharacterized protein (DUF2147 family)